MADLPTHDSSHHTDSTMNLKFELEVDDQQDAGNRPNSDPGPTGWRTPRASRTLPQIGAYPARRDPASGSGKH